MTRMTTNNMRVVAGSNEGAVRQAEGRIHLAVERLASKYLFHAKVLERFVVRYRPSIKTMAVTISGDDVLLLHNPAFVLAITLDELVAVLLHETHHVVLGHVLADLADFPDEWAGTVAQEVTANEFIVEPLPATPILLSQFPKLPPMESTLQRYNRLRRQTQRFPLGGSSGAVIIDPATGAGSAGTAAAWTGKDRKGSGAVLDDHEVWQEARADLGRSETAIRAAVHDAAIEVGADGVPDSLRSALAAMHIGRFSGDGRYQIDGSGRASLPWISLLRRYIGRHLRLRPDYSRPPRRCPELVGIVPGKRRLADRPRVMAVIDTSGSITDRLLEQISAELGRMAATFFVDVVECDAKVHSVYRYRPLKSVAGRGGTDLRPPFERDFLRKHRPDLLVFFTDGCGPAPTHGPKRLPVVWCLTAGGRAPAVWGRVIQMADAPG